jgi:dUTP pyrophosphatase
MIKFFIEPGYNVKKPEREFGNAGVDFFIPEYSESFIKAFREKNNDANAVLFADENGNQVVRIMPQGRANIPSGVRSRINANVALEAQNKSGIATKFGIVYGAATVDASYTGVIHLSLINPTNKIVDLPLGMKVLQFIPRLIDTSEVEVCDNMTLEEFYKDFEFSNRGEGAFGSTGV